MLAIHSQPTPITFAKMTQQKPRPISLVVRTEDVDVQLISQLLPSSLPSMLAKETVIE
jgi:hypothetical protein